MHSKPSLCLVMLYLDMPCASSYVGMPCHELLCIMMPWYTPGVYVVMLCYVSSSPALHVVTLDNLNQASNDSWVSDSE